jgi:hypothetical protein
MVKVIAVFINNKVIKICSHVINILCSLLISKSRNCRGQTLNTRWMAPTQAI